MTQKVNVPDPVHRRLKRESEQKDIAMGVIIREWMESHDTLRAIRGTNNFVEQTRKEESK